MRPYARLLPLLLAWACSAAPVPGAKPELNTDFRKPDVDVERWVGVLEAESREIATCRQAITDALGLEPGQAVADIGAGTGLFEEPLAHAVGPTGVVYAVDISPAFIDHIRERAAQEGLAQVEPVLCGDRSTGLPPASVDLAFVCDTYHHFEHPADTLASLRAALRPAGRLVVVDFERIAGQSRDWVFEHVRCGREQVVAEIEGAGFVFRRTLPVAGLTENYVIEFGRDGLAAARPAAMPAESEPATASDPQAAREPMPAPTEPVMIDVRKLTLPELAEQAAHGTAETRLAIITCAAELVRHPPDSVFQQADPDLVPVIRDKVALSMWASALPTVMTAGRPALEAREWSAEDVRMATAVADFLAILPQTPAFVFREGANAENRAEAERLLTWIESRMADPRFRASLTFTFDEGPYFPDVLTDVEALPHSDAVPTSGGVTIHVGEAARGGRQAQAFLQGVSDAGVQWTVFLDRTAPGCQVVSLDPDEPWGWQLSLSCGARVSVALDHQGQPAFYFVSS